jgi:hypothetical protein
VDIFDDDGDDLMVTFYDASDDSIIEQVYITGGSGTASAIWSGISSNMLCNWYVIADDGLGSAQSSTWTFETTYINVLSPAIPLPGFIPFGLIVIGTAGILSVITYLRRIKFKYKNGSECTKM